MTTVYAHAELTAALKQLVNEARHVKVHWDRLPQLAESIRRNQAHQQLILPDWANPQSYPDEFPAGNDCNTIQYFFTMVPQGYLHYMVNEGRIGIWRMRVLGVDRSGIHAQYACAERARRRGLDVNDPQQLVTMTQEDIIEFYRDETTGRPNLADLPGRLARFHEIGHVLIQRYAGSFTHLLERSEGYLFREDGNGIVQQLVREFPLGYGDWPFCKLSMSPARMLVDRQIAAIPSTDEYLRLTTIRDPEHFEAGADVARPFALTRLGILELDETLSYQLETMASLGLDSRGYAEMRAAAILVCRKLVQTTGVSSPHIGGELWATGFYRCPACRPAVPDTELSCTYKPICLAYQQSHYLFRLAPMVGTGD